jgi:non-ribosomal peptide synthetase component F
MRGELMARDQTQALPWLAQHELNWAVKDTMAHVGGKLEGWAHVRNDLFQPHTVRVMLRQYAQQLQHLHNRLIGLPTGGM